MLETSSRVARRYQVAQKTARKKAIGLLDNIINIYDNYLNVRPRPNGLNQLLTY